MEETVRPSISTSGTASEVNPNGPPNCDRFSIVPRALKPNVKLAPIAACTAWTPPTRMSATNASAGTIEKSRSNGSTTSTSMPQAAISSARRSTVVISRGSRPGVSTSRGCRSKVTATLRMSRARASARTRSKTA